jgi:uncharacterized protein YecE (DUF72 family)
MTTVHVGLPSLRGELARYAAQFGLLEVRPVDSSLPRLSKLRTWRREVPPSFVFSVVLPKIVCELSVTSASNEALQTSLEVASALEARCIVIVTPPSVTPTTQNKRRLAALVSQCPRDAVTIAWEPRGVWDTTEAAATAREIGAHLIVDVTRDPAPRGAILYTRLRGIGESTRATAGDIERVRAAIQTRREAFVVLEGGSPARVATALMKPFGAAGRTSAPMIIKPPIRLSAEDEEQ